MGKQAPPELPAPEDTWGAHCYTLPLTSNSAIAALFLKPEARSWPEPTSGFSGASKALQPPSDAVPR